MDPSASSAGPAPLNHDNVDGGLDVVAVENLLHERNQRGLRKIVLNFTPSWFSVTMGTGIVSILLHNLPYNGRWLYWISVVVFAFNVFLFVLFTVISVARYKLFRGVWSAMIRHPVQSMFIGTFPMGLATIINMICFVCVPAWGQGAAILAWTLWWIDVVLALATNMYMPFVIMRKHNAQLSTMTAIWLLPIVATIVAAASGPIVASVLENDQHALWTIIISYILRGCGVPLAMIVLAMYFQRLTIYSLPPREVILSVFLPLGPLGQVGFGIMQLGKDAMKIFPRRLTLSETAGSVFYIMGFAVALVLWGFGLIWLFFAIASITRSRFPFNMGWWGFTFPLGVYSVATTTIAKELPSLFFKVLGTIFSVAVVLLWIIVSLRTLQKIVQKEIFVAPWIKEWERLEAEKQVMTGAGTPED